MSEGRVLLMDDFTLPARSNQSGEEQYEQISSK